VTIAPLTAVYAWILFGERISVMEIAGGLLVITGVWIVGRREKRQPQESVQEELAPIAPG
jgi:drug/metabolite transporter (DMT)-like permease